MFRSMRRIEKQMSEIESKDLLTSAEFGVLSVQGEDGYPYGIPVNHLYLNQKLYFHCALSGHKISALKNNPLVCFTCVASAEIKSETFETLYESIVAFGRVELLCEGDEKMLALHAFIDRFSSDFKSLGTEYVEKNAARTMIIAMDIHHLTGKRGR